MRRPTALLEVAAALLVCAAFDLALLAPAPFTGAVRAPGDLIAATPAFDVDGTAAPPHNPMLSDWSQSICAWHRLVRTAWSEGRVPLWNDLSGCGAPLLANLQSEAFSPYLPLNLLFGEQYPDARQLALLLVAQLFTILLARRLGLSGPAATLAALAFAFASPLMIWSVYPMAGAWAFAPATALGFHALRERVAFRRVVLAGLPIGLAVLAGHVESGFLAALGGGLLALLLPVPGRGGPGPRTRYALAVPAAGAFGLALAAVVLLPFLDYLSESLVREVRALQPAIPNSPLRLATLLDRDALALDGDAGGRDPEFMERTFTAGRVVLALALLAVCGWHARRGRLVLALATTAAFALALASAPPAVMEAIDAVPPFSWTPLRRMNFLAALPLALLAGCAADALHPARRPGARRAIPAAVLALAALAAAGVLLAPPRLADLGQPRAGIAPASWLVLAGTVATGLFAWRLGARSPRWLRGLGLLLLVAVGAEGVLTWQRFVPVVPEAALHPDPAWARVVRGEIPGERVLPSAGVLPPDGHALVEVPSPLVYDAIRFGRHFRVLLQSGAFFGESQRTVGCDPRLLDVLGVGWTLTRFPSDRAPRLVDERLIAPGDPLRIERPGAPPEEAGEEASFTLELVLFATPPGVLPGDGVTIRLSDADGGVLEWRPETTDRSPTAAGLGRLTTEPDAAVRALLSQDPRLKRARYVALHDVPPETSFVLEIAAAGSAGPVHVLAVGRDGMGPRTGPELRDGELRLTRRAGALPRLGLAPSARSCDDLDAALAALRDPAFDPAREVLVEGDLPEAGSGEAWTPLAHERVSPEELRLEVSLERPRLLWFGEAPTRGWRVTVDGEEVAPLPANVLGQVVPLPAGRHVVRFVYAPRSFVVGAAISVFAVLLLLVALVVPCRRRAAALGLSVLLLPACGDAEDGHRLSLAVRTEDRQLVVDVAGAPEPQCLLAGRPWTGHDPLQTIEPELGVLPTSSPEGATPPLVLAEGVLAPGRRHALPLVPEQLAELPDPFALQVVHGIPGSRTGGPRPSRTWVVRRTPDGFEVEALGAGLWRGALPAILGGLLLGGLLAAALRRLRWTPLAAVATLVGVGLVGAGAAVTRWPTPPDRVGVEHENAAPPLLWPAAWDHDAYPYERNLGPGFTPLLEATRAARRPDEPVTLRVRRGDEAAVRRAIHWRRALGGTVDLAWDDLPVARPGLQILPPEREAQDAIAESAAGILVRREGQ